MRRTGTILGLALLVPLTVASLGASARAADPPGGFKPAPPASIAPPPPAPPAKKTPPPLAPDPVKVPPPPPDPAKAPPLAPEPSPPAPPPPPVPPPAALPAPSQAYPPPPAPSAAPAPASPPEAAGPPAPPAAPGAPVPGAPDAAAPALPGMFFPGATPPPGCPPCYCPPPGYGGYPPPGYYGNTAYPPPPADPGAHKHDGFFLRLGVGLGPSKLSLEGGPQQFVVEGGAGAFNLDVGAAVTPSLVIHGTISAVTATEPSLSVNSVDVGAQSNSTASLAGFGPGITYFFLPYNASLTATVGVASVTMDKMLANRLPKESGLGVLFRLALAKEWWVSDNWALGASIQAALASIKANPSQPAAEAIRLEGTWKHSSVALMFSATYN